MFYRIGVITYEVLHCGNWNFQRKCSCDFDLDLMTFIYELDPYCLKIYRMCEYELSASRFSKVVGWPVTELVAYLTRGE